ncbi:MAG: hypothetical protein ACOCYW_08735 [Roseicyclus sp.]
MLDWIGAHSDVINAVANAAIVAIWVVYLQLFLVTYRQQRRTSIHIDRGVATDEHARCIVTNMGQEPIYLLAVVVDFGQGENRQRAVVTDRDEMAEGEVSVQLERTNQGPMAQGEARDVGSLADLMQRARARLDARIERAEIDRMCVSALAISNQGEHLVAARKDFEAEHRHDGRVLFTPATVLTRQIRSRSRRRELLEILETRSEV